MGNDLETMVREADPLLRPELLDQVYGDFAGRLLEDIDAKTGRLPGAVPKTSGPTRSRRGWLVAAGAAIITIVVVGAFAALTARTSHQETAARRADAIAVVESQYEARNAHDFDAWIGHFTADALIFAYVDPRTGQSRSPDRHDPTGPYGFEQSAVINTRVEVAVPCRRITSTPLGDTHVECTITERDDFHGAAGMTTTRREVFVVDQHGEINEASATTIAFTQPGGSVFREEFWTWMEGAHPEIFTVIKPPLTNNLPTDPDHVRIGLSYVVDFVAQSDTYPVGGP